MKNFLSVGNVTQAVVLNENGLTLVLGSNTDSNGGTTRNGAGKTTILQAVSFGLFGKPLTKIKLPNLVNNINTKGMLVTIEFELNGTCYKIERGKKPDVMKFYADSEEQNLEIDETKGVNTSTQDEIDRLLGMSHTMFKHIVALNTFTDPFLKMTVGDQRTIIEELLGITQISLRADTLKKLVTATKDSITEHKSVIKATIEANDRLSVAIRNAETKVDLWDGQHNEKLRGLAEELAEMEALNFDDEISVFDTIDNYDTSQRTLDAEKAIAVNSGSIIRNNISSYEKDIVRLRIDTNGSDAQIKRMSLEVGRRLADAERAKAAQQSNSVAFAATEADIINSNNSECVCCGQAIAGTEHLSVIVEKLEQKKIQLDEEINRLGDDIVACETDAKAISSEIEKLRAEDATRRTSALERISEIETKIEILKTDLASNVAIISDLDNSLGLLGTRPSSRFASRDEIYQYRAARQNIEQSIEHELSLTNPNIPQVEDLRNAIQEVNYAPVNDAADLLRHQEFLLNLLTNKNSFIRKKIIDQNLAYLNSRLNHYLDKLGLPHEVVFQSDLSVDITLLGRDLDFEQLSRGEMNRVIMATSWSFRDVWESQNQSINLLMVDESLDSGTDASGMEAALSILKSMARDRGKNVFLISHRDELQARIDKTLLVTKENGFTAIQSE